MAKPVAASEPAPERDDLTLFTEGRLSDVEFLVENGEDPPQSFKAHKMMLAIRNEVFEAMFYGNLPEKDQVRINDLNPDGFFALLKYLYSRKATFVDIQQALRARTAAQKYMESKLVEACDAFVLESLKPADVCNLLEYIKKFGSTSSFDDLIDRLLRQNTVEVLESKAFIAASKETVIRVLKSTQVNITEYHVISTVYAWAIAHCKQETDDPSTAALQETMRPFLPQLRFLTLTLKDFVQGPVSWQIMSDSETLAVLGNLIMPGSKALPEGICTSTTNRVDPALGYERMAKPATTPIVALPRNDLSFFSDGRHTDVEFVVENGSDPPKRFRAHKMVLAMRNEVFEVMFYGNLPEQDKVLITDLHPDGFFCFLKYLYSQSATFADIPQALYTRSAAQKYMESKLVDACDAFIEDMQPSDVCTVLNYAIEHGNLTNFEDQIGLHLEKSGLQSSAFISAPRETVMRVLRDPRLRVTEYRVIKYVYAWAVAHCRHENGEPSASALRESMKPFLPELRFLTLSSEEFIFGLNSWNIFTESEAFSVLSNIIQRGSKPFPDGVSTVTVDRVPDPQ